MELGKRIAGIERLLFFDHYPECTIRIFKDVYSRYRIVAYRTRLDIIGYGGILIDRLGTIKEKVGDDTTLRMLGIVARMQGLKVYE